MTGIHSSVLIALVALAIPADRARGTSIELPMPGDSSDDAVVPAPPMLPPMPKLAITRGELGLDDMRWPVSDVTVPEVDVDPGHEGARRFEDAVRSLRTVR